MNVTISIDTISPRLDHLLRQGRDLRPVLRAMGTEFIAITQQAFDNPALRIAVWAARKETKWGANPNKSGRQRLFTNSGASTHPLLKKSGLLVKSFHTMVSESSVTISSDRPYARIQQFGGKAGRDHKVIIPSRPFMPIERNGEMPKWAVDRIARTAGAAFKARLGD